MTARAWVLVLLGACVGVRLTGLETLPIFIDEAIHIGWASQLAEEGTLDGPLRDGKVLQAALLAGILPSSARPLRAARTVSVAVGALGLAATAWLGSLLFGPHVGVVAAAFYLLCPFTLAYDRMALADTYLSTLASLSLALAVRLARRPRRGTALALGLGLAGCVLAKVTGAIVLLLPPLALLLLGRGGRRRPAILFGLASATAALIAGFPFVHFLQRSEQLDKANLVGTGRLEVAAQNFRTLGSWLLDYLTLPLLTLGILGLLLGLAYRRRETLLLALAAALPLLIFASLSVHWYPRYVLFAVPPLLVAAARGLVVLGILGRRALHGRARLPLLLALGLAAASPASVAFDARLVLDPPSAPWPEVESFQYVYGFSSGYGCVELVARLRSEAERQPGGILVLDDASAGRRTAWHAMGALLAREPRVELGLLDLSEEFDRKRIDAWARGRPVFVVAWSRRVAEQRAARPWTLMASFVKPNGVPAGALYVLPWTRRASGVR
ncbi:MAG: ArnT family glycosyltransferase [Vicinamibacteria bacterium]